MGEAVFYSHAAPCRDSASALPVLTIPSRAPLSIPCRLHSAPPAGNGGVLFARGAECGTLICRPCTVPWLHTAPLHDHSMATFSPQACHVPLAPSPVLYRPVAGERAGRAQVSTQASPPRSSTVCGRGKRHRILRRCSVLILLGFLPNGVF